MEGCGSSGMVSRATMLHALASGDIRNDVTERHHGWRHWAFRERWHSMLQPMKPYRLCAFDDAVTFDQRLDFLCLYSLNTPQVSFLLHFFVSHTSTNIRYIPPQTYVGRTLYHTCSIVHAPLRLMIFRLKATVMFGDAILAFDTRSISYSEKPYQPSGKPELPKLKLKFHDSPDVWPS